MKALKYIWRNVTRNKLRSMLTVLSVGFSLALMTILYGYLAMQDSWGETSKKYNRMVVMNIQGFAGDIPISYVDRVRTMDGVLAAVPFSWFGGTYKEKPMPFAQFGTDPDEVFNVWPEFNIDREQLKAWQTNRRGCVADRELAERNGWQLGERITLQGTFMPVNLDLELVGLFDANVYTDSLYFDWRFLDEEMKKVAKDRSGNAGIIYLKATDASVMPNLSKEIDSKFGSSENPTKTQTESAFAQMFADMLGNIRWLILFISSAVAFALLLITANAMAMSMRERTTEIAVLKAIGFSNAKVLNLVLGESTLIAVFGGLFGVGMGCLMLELLHNSVTQFFPVGIKDLIGIWTLILVIVASIIGLLSGVIPAIRAARLSVIDGLRRVI